MIGVVQQKKKIHGFKALDLLVVCAYALLTNGNVHKE